MAIIQEVGMLISLFCATFLIILPSACVELGFSWYYVPSRVDKNMIDQENLLRVQEAEQKLKHFEWQDSFRAKLHNVAEYNRRRTLEFAIVVVSTSRRSNPRYLLQSAVRLLTEVQNDDERSKLFILNVEDRPRDNIDANLLSTGNYINVLNISSSNTANNIFEKEKQDYVNALTIGLQQNSRYILIVEDDAMAAKGILWKLRYVLKWKMPWQWLHSGPQEWAFLKLYYPEKWQGFSVSEVPELLLVGFIGAACFMKFRQKFAKTQWRKISGTTLFLWYFAGYLYICLFVFLVGRAHWIELRKFFPFLYSVSNDFGCCTPAVIFPTKQAAHFVKFLNGIKCRPDYPLDYAFEDFRNTHKLNGLLVSPNLFSHIGFHSSLHSFDKDTREFKLLFNP